MQTSDALEAFVPVSEELLKHVPSDAVYSRVPLPDDQNALGSWREAAKHCVPPGEDDQLWGELIYGRGEAGEPIAFPLGPEGDGVRSLLGRNQIALEFFKEGIQRGRLQLPLGQDCGALMNENDDLATPLRDLTRIVGIQAKVLLAEGDYAGAGKLLIQSLHTGEMVCNGEGIVCDYLIGHCFRKGAIRWIQEWLCRPETPNPVLRELLSTIEHSLASPDGLAQCMQVDFCCWALPRIEQMPEGGALEEFVDRLLDIFYQKRYVEIFDSPEPQTITPTDGRLAWRREQIIALLRGHPCPFDKKATVRLVGELVAAEIRNLNYGFLRKWRRWTTWINWRWIRLRCRKSWPEQLTPWHPVDCLGPSEDARTRMNTTLGVMPSGRFDFIQPPTEDDIALCCRKLWCIHNPVGWMLAEDFLPNDYRWIVSEYHTLLEGTRKLLVERLAVQS